ncbi:MAG: cyclic nucleotide-binding domain-containing protein [Deltaproteobacteria bacterium]|nr:cyclic nucleotide-binding domain-containing protein [Deltaproteobacteria bacterium]
MNLPFLRPKIEHLDLYLSKKAYDKALTAIRSELTRNPRNTQLLRRQGQIQELADDTEGAVETYLELSHEYILEGFHARAIALYKRILEIDPTRKDILAELARLIDRESGSTVSQNSAGKRNGESIPKAASEGSELILEDTTDSPPAASETPEEIAAENLQQEESPNILETLPAVESTADSPVGASALGAPEASSEETDSQDGISLANELATSTLFTLFDPVALEEILASTNLRSYQEGDIIVTEGEEGASLFLLVEGQVKVFTRGQRGEHLRLAELGPGDLFGEVSVLHGKPRTATITAKSPISAIEVTKDDIDRISAKHPQVRLLLEDFCEQRAQSTIEALIRRTQS